jgi:hypothetical protein
MYNTFDFSSLFWFLSVINFYAARSASVEVWYDLGKWFSASSAD